MTTLASPPNAAAGMNDALVKFLNARSQGRRFHKHSIGDVDPDYSLGDFLISVVKAKTLQHSRNGKARLEKVYGSVWKAALSSDSGSTGGYVVPPELSYNVMETVEEIALFRRFANVQPMQSETLKLSLPDAASVQAVGVSPFFGGFNMTWSNFVSTNPESEPTWRQVELTAWPLAGICYASNPLLDDAVGLEAWLHSLFAHAVAWSEDFAFFQGTGLGMPQGIITSQATYQATRSGGPNTFLIADLGNMTARLMPGSWERAIWVVHPLVWQQIVIQTGFQINQPMVDSDKRSRGVRPYANLAGLDMYVSEKVSTLGTPGDVVLFDPWLYLIGERLELMIDLAHEYPKAWAQNQSVFRILARRDGEPQIAEQVTLQDGTKASAYVILK